MRISNPKLFNGQPLVTQEQVKTYIAGLGFDGAVTGVPTGGLMYANSVLYSATSGVLKDVLHVSGALDAINDALKDLQNHNTTFVDQTAAVVAGTNVQVSETTGPIENGVQVTTYTVSATDTITTVHNDDASIDVEDAGTAGNHDYGIKVNISELSDNILKLDPDTVTGGLYVPEISLESAVSTDDDIALVYTLKQGTETIGYINIPKDQFLQDAEFIAAATTEHKAEDSSVTVGDPYIRFTFAVSSLTDPDASKVGDEDITQPTTITKVVYVAVKGLVDVYTGGKGITVNGSVISADLGQGLEFTDDTNTAKIKIKKYNTSDVATLSANNDYLVLDDKGLYLSGIAEIAEQGLDNKSNIGNLDELVRGKSSSLVATINLFNEYVGDIPTGDVELPTGSGSETLFPSGYSVINVIDYKVSEINEYLGNLYGAKIYNKAGNYIWLDSADVLSGQNNDQPCYDEFGNKMVYTIINGWDVDPLQNNSVKVDSNAIDKKHYISVYAKFIQTVEEGVKTIGAIDVTDGLSVLTDNISIELDETNDYIAVIVDNATAIYKENGISLKLNPDCALAFEKTIDNVDGKNWLTIKIDNEKCNDIKEGSTLGKYLQQSWEGLAITGIGTIPSSATATTIVGYIQEMVQDVKDAALGITAGENIYFTKNKGSENTVINSYDVSGAAAGAITVETIEDDSTGTTKTSGGIHEIKVNVDNETIKINEDNQLYADIKVPTVSAKTVQAVQMTTQAITFERKGFDIDENDNYINYGRFEATVSGRVMNVYSAATVEFPEIKYITDDTGVSSLISIDANGLDDTKVPELSAVIMNVIDVVSGITLS